MALQDFLVQSATIQLEPTPMVRDRLGGAVRSGSWITVAVAVPCLVRPLSAALQPRDDARRDVGAVRIYFASDPVPTGIGTRNRIVVDGATYQVTGSVNINKLDRIVQVDCEVVKNA